MGKIFGMLNNISGFQPSYEMIKRGYTIRALCFMMKVSSYFALFVDFSILKRFRLS